MRSFLFWISLEFAITLLGLTPALAQVGTVVGTVTDTSGAVLPGAAVKMSPEDAFATSNNQGEFTIPGVTPGSYTMTVTYVGFSCSTVSATVVAGQVARVNVVMNVATSKDDILVVGERAHGEVEAINESRTSNNILNVLPSEVIASLPNANVADAIGRMPGVTLERDEGEGKYVQIRGTEPRLSNLTIDGVEVPSPEGGIRQVKLDVVPTEMIDTVQINKTLQANEDGDAIGGSVNLVTKSAGERPTLSIYGNGGFTPIINTVPVSEFGLTAGQRFGPEKRLGVMVGGSYDYNGRGINDIEPVPGSVSFTDLTPAYSNMDIREYKYNRNRFGVGGNVDYKLGQSSVVYIRGLFSDFKDSGRRWAYTLNDVNAGGPGTAPGFNTEIRAAHYQVASALLGGNHVFSKYYANWGLAASRSRVFNPINGGESVDTFSYVGPTSQCTYDVAATTNPYLPQWAPICFTEAYHPSNFVLSQVEDASHGQASQLNLQGQLSVGRLYSAGDHPGRFEMGFRIRNAHKFDDSWENFYSPNPSVDPSTITIAAFPTGLTDKNYYGGHYMLGPLASWDKIHKYFSANYGNFFNNGSGNTYGTNPANFDLVERVTAGYVMNTIDIGRISIVGGVRFEGTQFYSLSVDQTAAQGPCLCSKADGTYVDVLPSASVRFAINPNSGIRAVYSRSLSRPLPQQLTTSVSLDTSTAPPTYTIGSVLKPEHANNYDVLYERYLTPLGLIQAGFFSKNITQPIVTNVTLPSIGPYAGFYVSTPANAGTASVVGLELAFQQHFTYLPGALSGLGVSANYSFTSSRTTKVDQLRTDNPALLRQAPNTWNISPTYDRKRLSARLGLAYNGPNIFQYQYHNLQFDPNNPGQIIPNPQPGGVKGPAGDNYLYSHYQIDAQGSYYLGKGLTFTAAGLNLNNAVFGFYNGSPQYVVQREYYKPTYTFGLRWDLQHGR